MNNISLLNLKCKRNDYFIGKYKQLQQTQGRIRKSKFI